MSFPFVEEPVKANKLSLHAWHFDIATGKIITYDSGQNKFVPLLEEEQVNEEVFSFRLPASGCS